MSLARAFMRPVPRTHSSSRAVLRERVCHTNHTAASHGLGNGALNGVKILDLTRVLAVRISLND